MSKDYSQELQQMVDLILTTGHEDNLAYFSREKERLEETMEAELAKLAVEHERRLSLMSQRLEDDAQRQRQREALGTKQQIVTKKQAYLAEVIDSAEEEMNQWPKERFSQLVAAVFRDNPLKGLVEVKLASQSQGGVTAEALHVFAEAHPEAIEYHLSEDVIPNDGGFILCQEGIEYNFLYSSLLEQINEEMTFGMAKFLFEDEVG